MNIQVRPGTIEDCDTIHTFISELANYLGFKGKIQATPADIRRDGFGSNPKFHAILAHDAGKTVGIAVYFFTYSTWAGRRVLNLHDIIVSKASRRSGVGRHLLSYLAKEAKKNDCARIDLEVRSYNEARKFYEKLGFTKDNSNLIYELNRADFKKIRLKER